MIRWSFVLPRLIIVALVLAFFCFALDPILRYSLVASGQSLTGAKVEVGSLLSSLFESAVRIEDVAAADPKDPMKNLFQAEEVTLQFDTRALLLRRWIVDRGHVRGLRFDTVRESSGELEETEEETGGSAITDALAAAGEQLLDNLGNKLEDDFNELESVRLSRELMVRWPAEYAQLEERADQLKLQIKEVRAAIETARDNPLKALADSERVLLQIDSLTKAPGQLRGQLGRLRQQAEQDKRAMEQARQRDMETIQQKLKIADVDTETLSRYLIDEHWSDEVKYVLQWVERARALVATGGEAPEAHRHRGIDIVFPGIRPQPSFLVRHLLLEGEAVIDGQPVQFAGTVSGITNEPDVYGHPTYVKLQTQGDVALKVHAVVDHTQAVPQTQVVVDCPRLIQQPTKLGKAHAFSVEIPRGAAHVWAQLQLTNYDDLSGRIIFKRDDVSVTPTMHAQYANKLLTNPWEKAFGEIREMHAVVDMSGTMKKPTWQLQTNVARQLSTGLRTAWNTELAAQRDQLMARLQTETDGQLASFQQMLTAKQDEVLAKLNLSQQEVAGLKQLLVKNSGLEKFDLGRSPLGKIFR